MPLTVWLAAASISLAAIVLWWALANDERHLSQRAADNLGPARNVDLRKEELTRPPLERLVAPIAKNLGLGVRRFTPLGWLATTERRLGASGLLGRWSSDQVIGAKLLAGGACAVFAIFRFSEELSSRNILLGLLTVGIGFFLPDLLLSSIGSRRQEAIERALPDVLDQLTISVEAGLGFEAAIARIGAKDNTPLSTELARMMQDIQLGVPRANALEALGDRVGVDDLRNVVLALRQAEKLGVPLAKTLRVQALEMREKRRFRAEEQAHKLPVKMIFPLGLCILPALFIVILGPAAIQIRDVFDF